MRPLSSWRAFNRTFGTGAFVPPRTLFRPQRCHQSTTDTIKQYAQDAERATRDSTRSKRLLYLAGGTLAVGGSAYAVSDEAKYIYHAVQRTGRVASTLLVCVNE